MPVDPILSSLMRAAANYRWAVEKDRPAATAKARAALRQKWLDMADGDPVRAESFRKAHYAKMTAASLAARAARKAGRK